MKAGGGKAKGAQFERLICKQLSLWITAGKKDDVFWRSAMSGGRATITKGPMRSNQVGDISAVGKEGMAFLHKFMVECKFYKKIDIEAMLIKRSGRLIGFWNVARKEAKKHNKLPLLIFKQNGMDPMILISPKGAEYLGLISPVIVFGTYTQFYWLQQLLNTGD